MKSRAKFSAFAVLVMAIVICVWLKSAQEKAVKTEEQSAITVEEQVPAPVASELRSTNRVTVAYHAEPVIKK